MTIATFILIVKICLKIILSVFITLISHNVYSQKKSEKDSLLKIYHSPKTKHDTSFVKLLNNLSRLYRLSVPDTAIKFGKDANELASAIPYEKGFATSLNYIGVAYFYKGDYPVAQEYQRKALEYAQARNMKPQISNALNSLALAYQYQGNHTSALENYLKALQFEEDTKNYLGQIKVLSNIGILWKRQGNYEKAIEFGKRALSLCDSIKDTRAVRANIYNNIGLNLIELKKFDEGLTYVQKSLKLNEELGNKIYELNCLSNIGYCHLNMGHLNEAQKYLLESLTKARQLNSDNELLLVLINLSEVYVRQHKAKEALPLSLESLALCKKNNDRSNILVNYRGLASIYKELNQLALAYQFLEKAEVLSDSLKNTDINQRISELQKSYELNKKESEINLLVKDAHLKRSALIKERDLRYGLIGLIASLCLLAGFIYYSFSVKTSLNKKLQKQNEEISEQKKLIEQINEDLKARALRAQMNPHFIFNSLNSIQFLILKNNNDRAYTYLAIFAKLLRKVLDNSQQNTITLANELETIKLYLGLEALRFNDGFEFDIKTHFETNFLEQVKVMPMIIQPFIENAVLHGLMQKNGNRKLEVDFFLDEIKLRCEITDNGIGRKAASEISKQKNKMYESKGMSFTNERMNVFNNMNNKNSKIEVIDLMDNEKNALGTKVIITFQY